MGWFVWAVVFGSRRASAPYGAASGFRQGGASSAMKMADRHRVCNNIRPDMWEQRGELDDSIQDSKAREVSGIRYVPGKLWVLLCRFNALAACDLATDSGQSLANGQLLTACLAS